MLDRDVIGFQSEAGRPIPLAPIALLSDPDGDAPGSWEYSVEKGMGPDSWHFDPVNRVFRSGGDGLHEMPVTLAGDAPNACVLALGVVRRQDTAEQVRSGVTAEQLRECPDGRIALDDDGRFLAPVLPFSEDGLDPAAGELLQSLEDLRAAGEPRVWPLFRRIDPGSDAAVVTGFVAARVVRAAGGEDDGSAFVLQPCMFCTASAVTDASRRPAGAVGNRYVCKIRLVE